MYGYGESVQLLDKTQKLRVRVHKTQKHKTHKLSVGGPEFGYDVP